MKKEKLPKTKSVKTETITKKKTGEKVSLKRKQQPKTNFNTEKFVDIENGAPLRKPVASLNIEVFRVDEDSCDITVIGTGEKKFMVEALTKAMIQSDGYFELFMEAAALAMITKAESAASTKKKVSKKTATNKKK
jgi:hypothetical protein